MFINFAKNGDYYAMKHLELGFVGFGLIGGSIARSLKKQNEDVSVHVYSRRKNPALDEGMAEGIIDSIWYEIDERFFHLRHHFSLCAGSKKYRLSVRLKTAVETWLHSYRCWKCKGKYLQKGSRTWT